jgi:transcriptional regulator with XRE-family HTH domain
MIYGVDNMNFSERLKELRVEKNLTQEELGEKLNLTKANISKYETGRIEPNLETLNYLSEFFDVSIDFLLGRTNIRTPITTVALHRKDGYDEDLPDEAKR